MSATNRGCERKAYDFYATPPETIRAFLRAVMRLGWEIPNPVNAMAKEKAKRFPFAVLTPTNV